MVILETEIISYIFAWQQDKAVRRRLKSRLMTQGLGVAAFRVGRIVSNAGTGLMYGQQVLCDNQGNGDEENDGVHNTAPFGCDA
jgi:hypothetical protein